VPGENLVDGSVVVFFKPDQPFPNALGGVHRYRHTIASGEPPSAEQTVQIEHMIGMPVGDYHRVDAVCGRRVDVIEQPPQGAVPRGRSRFGTPHIPTRSHCTHVPARATHRNYPAQADITSLGLTCCEKVKVGCISTTGLVRTHVQGNRVQLTGSAVTVIDGTWLHPAPPG